MAIMLTFGIIIGSETYIENLDKAEQKIIQCENEKNEKWEFMNELKPYWERR